MDYLSRNILLISDKEELNKVLQKYLRKLCYKNVKSVNVGELSDYVFKKMQT